MITLGKPRYGRNDNIEKDIKKKRWQRVDRKHLTQGGGQWQALMEKSMNFLRSINFATYLSS
jgi:hypothetical protein